MRASERDRADVVTARADWHRVTPAIDPARFVFLDESGVTTNMLRRYGRSRRGTRVHDHAPHHHDPVRLRARRGLVLRGDN